jgi:hypothetical protein
MSASSMTLAPSRRTVAITAGMLGAAGAVLVIAAAFTRSGSDHDARAVAAAATQGGVVSAVSGAVVAPRIAVAPAAPTESIEVPVISVDSLPVATKSAPPKPAGSGRLAIVASPGSCSVSIDGVSRGLTPVAGVELTAGLHKIECTPPVGRAKTVSVTISDGASARYKFALED